MTDRTLSPEGAKLMHYYESLRLKAYPDPGTGGAPWTIGWGHTGPDVHPGLEWTREQADAAFLKDVSTAVNGMNRAIARDVKQHQFDAIVSLAYNAGVKAITDSTLIRIFNTGDVDGVPAQFKRWDKAGGKSMLGLRRRRAAEASMFQGADADCAIAIGLKAE